MWPAWLPLWVGEGESARGARLTGLRQLGGSGVPGRVRPGTVALSLGAGGGGISKRRAKGGGGQCPASSSCHTSPQGAEEAGEGAGIVSLECVTNTSHGSVAASG